MSAVAMMVSEPPSSMLRAGEARQRVEQDDHVALVLDEALGLLNHHVGDLHVACRRFVEC